MSGAEDEDAEAELGEHHASVTAISTDQVSSGTRAPL